MGKHLPIASVLVAAALAASSQAQGFSYARSGIGGNLGFVVAGGTATANLGFDVAANGDIAFTLGRFGEAHYKPVIGVWFGGRHAPIQYWSNGVLRDGEESWFNLEVHLDFADLAYYFPLPENIVFRPYAGFGPMVAIDHWSYQSDNAPNQVYDYTDARFGFNFFGGGDFRISPTFAAYAEVRGRVSSWDVFKLTGGVRWTIGAK